MKLWLISQDSIDGFDSYNSAVVSATTAKKAANMHPDGNGRDLSRDSVDWLTDTEKVQARYLGTTKKGTPEGVICARFNTA